MQRQRADDAAERDIVRAYLTARYIRLAKMPSLDHELQMAGSRTRSTAGSMNEQRAVLEQLSAKYGLPLMHGQPDGEVWIL